MLPRSSTLSLEGVDQNGAWTDGGRGEEIVIEGSRHITNEYVHPAIPLGIAFSA